VAHLKRGKRRAVAVEEPPSESEGTDATAGAYAVRWWLAEQGNEAAGKLWVWIDRLRSRWAADGIGDLIHEAIYSDEPLGVGSAFDGTHWMGGRPGAGTTPMNVIKSLVDSATARLTKIRSMPCITATNAKWSEKRFARKQSRILRLKMGSTTVERESPLVIRDKIVRGTGVRKVVRCDSGDTVDIDVERIPAYEIVVDPREAYYGKPRSIAHVRPMAREVLIASFPEKAEEIRRVEAFKRMDPWMMFVYQGPTFADHVEVAESWHLPSGRHAKDGQHIITIRGTTLLRERWRRPRFPISEDYWQAPFRGWRGKGVVSEMVAAQDMINEILTDARDSIRFGSQLKVFMRRGTVNKHHLRARHPAVIEYDDVEPHYVAADPVSKQAWAIAFQIKQAMYELAGIPNWASEGNRPLGTNASGKAIDTIEDVTSDRFAHIEMDQMQARVEVGRLINDEARAMWMEAHGKDDDDKVAFDEEGDRLTKKDLAPWIAEHDWSKIDIDGGDYHLNLEPTNYLSGTRAGKLEEAAEAAKAGLIPDPSMTAALFDEPDLVRMNRPILGPLHQIEWQLEGLVDTKREYIDLAPDNYQNLALAHLMANGELGECIADGATEDEEGQIALERLRQYIGDCERLINMKNAASQAPSLQGAQANTTIAQANAATLQPGMGAPPAPAPGPGMQPGAPS
jgi:hypothetical protein